jgi:hypothetical protein
VNSRDTQPSTEPKMVPILGIRMDLVWKALAGLNALLMAVAIVMLNSVADTIRAQGERITSLEITVAVMQSNGFSASDAVSMYQEIAGDRELHLNTLRTEIMQRFDRLEDRINRMIGGEP